MSKLIPPAYCKDAIPTDRGWVHPKTNELLVSHKGLLSKINNESSAKPVAVAPAPVETKQEVLESAPKEVASSDSDEVDFDSMTKSDLEKWARENGIELDARKTKSNMIEDLKSQL